MTRRLPETRVAVVGASGIGKHHAKWWALEGATVCAFAGTSGDSVRKTASTLRELFGFSGRGYADYQVMLDQEKPDIVDVCTPPPLHFDHCRRALDAGCHVLCEKPFVYDSSLRREELLAQGRELIGRSRKASRRLGICTQYTFAARMFSELWSVRHPGEALVDYVGHLESPARGRAPDPRRTWVDLAPHPLSMLLELAPGCAVDWGSLETRFEGYEAVARFQVRSASGSQVQCAIITRNTLEPPLHVRRCSLNGWDCTVEGTTGAQGVYCSRIVTPDGEAERPDMMHFLIREFLHGRTPANAETALANLDIMLRVMEAAA